MKSCKRTWTGVFWVHSGTHLGWWLANGSGNMTAELTAEMEPGLNFWPVTWPRDLWPGDPTWRSLTRPGDLWPGHPTWKSLTRWPDPEIFDPWPYPEVFEPVTRPGQCDGNSVSESRVPNYMCLIHSSTDFTWQTDLWPDRTKIGDPEAQFHLWLTVDLTDVHNAIVANQIVTM